MAHTVAAAERIVPGLSALRTCGPAVNVATAVPSAPVVAPATVAPATGVVPAVTFSETGEPGVAVAGAVSCRSGSVPVP